MKVALTLLLAGCALDQSSGAPHVSLTCEFAEYQLLEVGAHDYAGACYRIRTDAGWRVTPIEADHCPSDGDRCVLGRPGQVFVVYRSQRMVTSEGGWEEAWINCDEPEAC